ncbi:nucleotidyltransferase domain-containing protein [Nakamurella sp. GG22]
MPCVTADLGLSAMARRLTAVSGVIGVVLGGSRARGEHTAESDVDLGVYYRPALDVAALQALAVDVSGPDASVTEPGAWGPWVDGGGWLTVDGVAVDWIYRDLDRVAACWADAEEGRYGSHQQIGHPFGVASFSYPGELALGIVLADPTGELTEVQRSVRHYPAALGNALVTDCLWESSFLIGLARKGVGREDTAYISGCLFRVVMLCAHALHARDRRWLINEKGAVTAAAALPSAPHGFGSRAHALLAVLGRRPAELSAAIDAADRLVGDVQIVCDA